MYGPGGMTVQGMPMMGAPGMGYAYMQPQRPGSESHPMSPMGHAALGAQALGPQGLALGGMGLPPGAIPMYGGYAPGGAYGLPLHMLQGMQMPPAPRPRAPSRPQPPSRRANGGPGLQRHQRCARATLPIGTCAVSWPWSSCARLWLGQRASVWVRRGV